ncbi:MAG: methyltransferase [Rhizobacter sp.]|nr:methyltransferase [Rhizobacter sp.]
MGNVVAPLQYVAWQVQPLHTYAYNPPGGAQRFNGTLVAHTMPIHDARGLDHDGGLQDRGFMLAEQRSDVLDFHVERQLIATGYPETEALVLQVTGARHARVFDHTLRRRAAHRPQLDGLGGSFAAVREPVGRVHADYTPMSAPLRLQHVLGSAAAGRAMRGRYLIIGLWRPLLREPLQDAPLALADARSVRRDQLMPNDLVYPDRRGQTYAVRHDPAHRWYYFAGQTRDEVTVFVHYDSERALEAVTGACPHTAFEHPQTPVGATPRQSIEFRALAWYED